MCRVYRCVIYLRDVLKKFDEQTSRCMFTRVLFQITVHIEVSLFFF